MCQTNTTLDNGQVSGVVSTFDQYNNVTDHYEYDNGAAPALGASCSVPGGYLRHTNTQYMAGSYNGSSVHILGLPSEVKIYDGSSNLYSDTKYAYDQYNGGGLLFNCSGLVGHDNANYGGGAGGGNLTRGNPTTISQYNNTNSSWLNTSLAYDIAGNVRTATDANGHATSYLYNDNYSDGNNSRNTYGRVTTVTNALSQSITLQYDFGTGKPTLTTDLNGVNTAYSYIDPLDRITLIRRAASTSYESQTKYTYTTPLLTTKDQDQNVTNPSGLQTQVIYL